MHIYGKVKQASITINYADDVSNNSKQFDTYQQLLDFLKQHPAIAKLLDYETKDNTTQS